MVKERIVFQTRRSFSTIIASLIIFGVVFTYQIQKLIEYIEVRHIIAVIILCFIVFSVVATQEKQITLYETYLRIDSKTNIFFKPKEFKYSNIKLIVVSYKSWRPTFIGGINITYMKDGKEQKNGFVVDVKNRNVEYPELLKHLKELGVYAYEVENV